MSIYFPVAFSSGLDLPIERTIIKSFRSPKTTILLNCNYNLNGKCISIQFAHDYVNGRLVDLTVCTESDKFLRFSILYSNLFTSSPEINKLFNFYRSFLFFSIYKRSTIVFYNAIRTIVFHKNPIILITYKM